MTHTHKTQHTLESRFVPPIESNETLTKRFVLTNDFLITMRLADRERMAIDYE
jgi:hypothetical protein